MPGQRDHAAGAERCLLCSYSRGRTHSPGRGVRSWLEAAHTLPCCGPPPYLNLPPRRLATPLTLVLLAYSVGITVWAAMRNKQAPAAAAAAMRTRAAAAGGAAGPLPLGSIDTDSLGSADLSDSEEGPAVTGMALCKVCGGEGQVDTRVKRRTIPCPCCLVSARVRVCS